MLDNKNTLLVIIDVQEKLLNSVFNKDILKKNSIILSKVANILSIPTVITEQYPKGLGSTIDEIKTELNNTKYFEKTNFDAFLDETILSFVVEYKRKDILIFGIETHICVYQSALDLLKRGYSVTIVADACGSRSEYEYEMALNVLEKAGANIKTTEMILFELLKSSRHPNFKEMQAFIK